MIASLYQSGSSGSMTRHRGFSTLHAHAVPVRLCFCHPRNDPVSKSRPQLRESKKELCTGRRNQLGLSPLAGRQDSGGQPVGIDALKLDAAAGLSAAERQVARLGIIATAGIVAAN